MNKRVIGSGKSLSRTGGSWKFLLFMFPTFPGKFHVGFPIWKIVLFSDLVCSTPLSVRGGCKCKQILLYIFRTEFTIS